MQGNNRIWNCRKKHNCMAFQAFAKLPSHAWKRTGAEQNVMRIAGRITFQNRVLGASRYVSLDFWRNDLAGVGSNVRVFHLCYPAGTSSARQLLALSSACSVWSIVLVHVVQNGRHEVVVWTWLSCWCLRVGCTYLAISAWSMIGATCFQGCDACHNRGRA